MSLLARFDDTNSGPGLIDIEVESELPAANNSVPLKGTESERSSAVVANQRVPVSALVLKGRGDVCDGMDHWRDVVSPDDVNDASESCSWNILSRITNSC